MSAKTKRALLTLTALLLASLAESHAADRPISQDASATPPGKTYVYKHSAGQPREMEVCFPVNHDPPRQKCPA